MMHKGNIKILPEIIAKIKQLPFYNIKHLDEEKYKNLGYDRTVLSRHEQYGTGDAIRNNLDWGWTDIFLPTEWKDVGLQFDRAHTGFCIPPHKDHYHFYIKKFSHHEKDIRRRMVFLEDWQSGHYFQINEEVFVKWRQGDWLEFGTKDIHLGGNIGPNPRYTLQITGVKK